MFRIGFYLFAIFSMAALFTLSHFWEPGFYFFLVLIPILSLGIYDIFSSHNILRNYPIIGHVRYMFEFVRPEIQQYFVATNLSGRPYNRELRSLVYQRAQDEDDTHPFGTEHDLDKTGYHFAEHSMQVKKVPETSARTTVGGPQCKKPYSASRINISSMSFGALSNTAVLSMNLGAKLGDFAQWTGEGGLTRYHLQNGGDCVWQIGTGYFGCRTLDGDFDPDKFKEKATLDAVKMIEIKISQGAKPSHGGVLPAAKITEEIAEFRGVPMGKDCLSPPTHTTFSTPKGLLKFITELRELSGGKPVGFKLCIGKKREFMAICKAMLETGVYPDFITVDGAEGGTGAAPLEFTNRFGMPINEGLAFVHNCLVGSNLRQHIHVIASGKVTTGFDVVMKHALGANMVNIARAMMFAVGCIQALRCNENTCPTGVTSQDPRRAAAVVPAEKARHVFRYHANTMKSFLDLTGAMGFAQPDDLQPQHIYLRQTEAESINFADVFHYVEAGNFLSSSINAYYRQDWEASSAESF